MPAEIKSIEGAKVKAVTRHGSSFFGTVISQPYWDCHHNDVCVLLLFDEARAMRPEVVPVEEVVFV